MSYIQKWSGYNNTPKSAKERYRHARVTTQTPRVPPRGVTWFPRKKFGWTPQRPSGTIDFPNMHLALGGLGNLTPDLGGRHSALGSLTPATGTLTQATSVAACPPCTNPEFPTKQIVNGQCRCVRSSDHRCPEGQEMDRATNTCRPKCPAGTRRARDGRCVEAPDCPEGQGLAWDGQRYLCRPLPPKPGDIPKIEIGPFQFDSRGQSIRFHGGQLPGNWVSLIKTEMEKMSQKAKTVGGFWSPGSFGKYNFAGTEINAGYAYAHGNTPIFKVPNPFDANKMWGLYVNIVGSPQTITFKRIEPKWWEKLGKWLYELPFKIVGGILEVINLVKKGACALAQDPLTQLGVQLTQGKVGGIGVGPKDAKKQADAIVAKYCQKPSTVSSGFGGVGLLLLAGLAAWAVL